MVNALTEIEINALNEALAGEYLAFATYNQVVADLGEVQPFSDIREAEIQRVDTLCALFVRYGLPVPDNQPERAMHYASLQEACEAGVTAETTLGNMYQRLLDMSLRPDILTMFRDFQEASHQRHLTAFRCCAQRPALSGAGRGRGYHIGGGWDRRHENLRRDGG
ncbi:hypothetical protein MNBD_GAMMA18-2040 [hydrothermal vent metagenome]|uniref:DUF2202 domain-containing protein n=1 Tax=hydrothermal vent metagenome TaxID=652676 RepID=A0A3B1AAR1_9ZZZZ